jgi:hypothetical protein
MKERGKLKKERDVTSWVPVHLTDSQKADPTQYDAGDLIEFYQNAPGHTKGSRLVVEEGVNPPVELANRYVVYKPVKLSLAVGDRVRITAGGKTKDGKHRLSNGSLFTVEGIAKNGDIIVDHGWVIDREFGHLTHGYSITSHASQGVTVHKVFVGISSDSLPATNQRTAYVALTRGKEQAVLFTDDKDELLRAMRRLDEPVSATEVAKSTEQKPVSLNRLPKVSRTADELAAVARRHHEMQQAQLTSDRGLDHDR